MKHRSKIIVLVILVFANIATLFAQNKIGVVYSCPPNIEIVRAEELDGAGSTNGTGDFEVGIIYLHELNKWLEIEAAFEYTKIRITNTSAYNPNYQTSITEGDMSLMNIPVVLRANFLKYFFVNAGVFLGFNNDVNEIIDSQTGLGLMTGVGIKYDFEAGVSIFVTPYLKYYAAIPFSHNEYQQHVGNSGLKFGITYDINKFFK